MSKWGRSFKITITMYTGAVIIIQPPFTIRFNVNRAAAASLNTLDLDIYNLAPATRDQLLQDPFIMGANQRSTIKFEAGYIGSPLSVIYQGTVFSCNSARSGVDIITSLHSTDGGWDIARNFIFQSAGGKPNYKTILSTLANTFAPNLTVGAITGNIEGVFQRPVVLEGNVYNLLQKYSDNKCFIDLERIYILKDNEILSGTIPLINADTGLLDTPRRDDTYLTFSTLFEPTINCGMAIDLYSQVNPIYSKQYKVFGIQHTGTISESVGGDLRTIFQVQDVNKFSGKTVTVSGN